MRDWWYGDKRDIVKWGAILVLAREKSINTVLQVALYRPDRKKEYKLAVNGTPKDLLPNEVIRHFRDINKVKELVAMVASTQLRIDVHKDLFQKQKGCKLRTQEKFREDYFDKVAKKIKEYGDAVIVFLDPDTGIAPKTYSYNHVTCKEIQKILRAMKRGDVLLFYQHAWLGNADWRNLTKKKFVEAVGPTVPVNTITCENIAHDVAFFVVERSEWVDDPPEESKPDGAA